MTVLRAAVRGALDRAARSRRRSAASTARSARTCPPASTSPSSWRASIPGTGHARPTSTPATTRRSCCARAARSRRLTEGGMVLGMFEAVPYGGGRAELGPGDTLVIFSDGRDRDLERKPARSSATTRLARIATARGAASAPRTSRPRSCASWTRSPAGSQGHRRPHPHRPQAHGVRWRTPAAAAAMRRGCSRTRCLRAAARGHRALRAAQRISRPTRPPAATRFRPALDIYECRGAHGRGRGARASTPTRSGQPQPRPADDHAASGASARPRASTQLPVHGAAAGPLHAHASPRRPGGRRSRPRRGCAGGLLTVTPAAAQGPARPGDRRSPWCASGGGAS